MYISKSGYLKIIYATALLLIAASFISVFSFSKEVNALSGSDFQAGRIIDDAIFFNSNQMNPTQIQQFLNSKVPACDTNGTQPIYGTTRAAYGTSQGNPPPYTCLKDYTESVPTIVNGGSDLCTASIAGGVKSAAQIIFDVSQACGINPQVLVVLLQKEQSLVTDDWPWSVQYRSATGYGCPDTAPCDSEYYGFFNQVYQAAKAFKRYAANPNSYNYKTGNNFIYYNPNLGGCGGSNVYIENQATANLYIYTPYQPNTAALNNLYGTGDGCSAYGNRNFWRLFNDWFGPTRQGEYSLVIPDSGSLTQYLLLDGILHPIPSTSIKEAWGLLDDTLIYMNQSYISSLPVGQPLNRVTRPSGSLDLWLVDGGRRYKISSPEMMAAWGLTLADINDTPSSIVNTISNQGNLSYNVRLESGGNIYLVDGGTLRIFQNTETLKAWEGEIPSNTILSSSYLSSFPTSTNISLYIVESSGNHYLISNGSKYLLTGSQATAFGYNLASNVVVDPTTLSRMTSKNLSYFIKSSLPTTYLADGGSKLPVQSPNILNSWSANKQPAVTTLTSTHISDVATGATIDTYLATNGSQTYLLDGHKRQFSSTIGADLLIKTPILVSQNFLDGLSTAATTTRFFKQSGLNASPAVYVISAGQKYHIPNLNSFIQWGAGLKSVTEISQAILNSYPTAGTIGATVSNSTQKYYVDNGRLIRIEPEAYDNFTGENFIDISSGLVTELGVDAKTLSAAIDGQHADYYLESKALFTSNSADISTLWDLGSGPFITDVGLLRFVNRPVLSKFVKSSDPNDLRIFIKDISKLYIMPTPIHVENLGYAGEKYIVLDPSEITNLNPTLWTAPIAQDSGNQYFVFDNGIKRTFANTTIRDQWTGTIPAQPKLSSSLLKTFPSGSVIGKSIKAGGPAVYAVNNLVKSHITNPNLYISNYAPYTQVGSRLVIILP